MSKKDAGKQQRAAYETEVILKFIWDGTARIPAEDM